MHQASIGVYRFGAAVAVFILLVASIYLWKDRQDTLEREEARGDLARWLLRWQERHPKLCAWVEANIDETFAFYRLPREHHKHLKSTNMLERLNQEIKRRTLLVRIFPNEESCLRLVRALAVEIHEEWVDENRYLDMELLREHLKHLLTPQPKAA